MGVAADDQQGLGCRRCPLAEGRTMIVDGAGDCPAELMIVGEAPGEQEDRAGSPFVGQSGKLLRTMLAEAGVGDAGIGIWLTNSVRCRPPKNRPPHTSELETCRDWLKQEFHLVHPRVILAVGKTAQVQVWETLQEIGLECPDDLWYQQVVVLEGVHPAFVLRKPEARQGLQQVIRDAVLMAQGKKPYERPEMRPYQVVPLEDRYYYPCPRWLALDTETDDLVDGIERIGKARVCWTMSNGEWTAISLDDPASVIPWLPHVYLHHAKYDLPLLGIDPWDRDRWDDTMLMAYVLRYEGVGLKPLAWDLCGIPEQKTSEIVGVGRKRRPFSQALQDDWDNASRYALEDALRTSRIAQILEPQLHRDPVLVRVYDQEKRLVPILMEMEDRGVLIDREALQQAGQVIAREQEVARQAWEILVGPGVNPMSPQQVGPALVQVGLELHQRGENGNLTTDEATLLASLGVAKEEDIALDVGDLPSAAVWWLLQYRQYTKLKSTYVDGILRRLDLHGVLHPEWKQHVTETGRLSSANPNVQNIPVRGGGAEEVGKAIRAAFIARPGYRIVKGDFSQLEVRIYADYTKEPVLLQAYPWDGPAGDAHQGVADELGIPRWRAKNVLFGVIYGAEEQTTAETAGVPREQAGEFLTRLRQRLPSLIDYRRQIAGMLQQRGYVETRLGWRNYYPRFWSPIRKEQQEALRQAANLPIQGTAAGIAKAMMIAMHPIMRSVGGWLLLQVHDELVYEVPEGKVEWFAQQLRDLAREVGRRYIQAVPLAMDVKAGENWRDTVIVGGSGRGEG